MPLTTPNSDRLRSAALAALAVVMSGCTSSGCGSHPEYPPEMPFESRSDRLVLKLPNREPDGMPAAKQWDEHLAGLDVLGGKTSLPDAIPVEQRKALDAFLAETFGTPGEPKIEASAARNERLGLTADHLKEGS